MNAIAGFVAEALLLGSIALLVWGAALTLGQLFRDDRRRRASETTRSRGEERRSASRAGFANPRRRRFGRLSAH
jgi:hypothetical protein